MSDGSDWLGEAMDCFRAIDEFIPGTSSAVAALLIGKMARADAYLLGLFEEAWGAAERRMRAYAEQEVPYAVDAIREFWTDEIADEFLARVWAPFVRECQDAADGFAAMRAAVAGFRLEVLTLALTVAVSLVWLAVGLIMAISSIIVSGGASLFSTAGLWAAARQAMERAVGEAMERIGALAVNVAHLEFRKVFADVAARALADRVARDVFKHVPPKGTVAGLKAGLDPVAARALTGGAFQLQKELKDRLFRQFSEQFAGKGAGRVGAGGVERLVGGGLGGDFEREALDRLVQRAADTTMGRELVRYFGAKAAMGAGFMGGRTLFVQGLEKLAGARGSIDWGEVGSESAEGLVMGGLMGGRGFVGRVVTGAVSGASASALGDGIRLAQAGLAGGVSGLESAWAGTNLRADVLTGALGGAAFGALLGGHGDRFQENVAVVAGERIGQETRLLFDGRENGFGTVPRVEAPDVRIVGSDVRGTLAAHGDTAVWLDTDGKVLMREEARLADEGAAEPTGSDGVPVAPLALLAGGAGGGSGSPGSGSAGGGRGSDASGSDDGSSGSALPESPGGASRGAAAPDGEASGAGPRTRPWAMPANNSARRRPHDEVRNVAPNDLTAVDGPAPPPPGSAPADSGTAGEGDSESEGPLTLPAGVDAHLPGQTRRGEPGATPGRPVGGDVVVRAGGVDSGGVDSGGVDSGRSPTGDTARDDAAGGRPGVERPGRPAQAAVAGVHQASVQHRDSVLFDENHQAWRQGEAHVLEDRAVETVLARTSLSDPEAAGALRQAYAVARDYTGPFLVNVAHEMLADMRTEVMENPARKIVFIGRDGYTLATAIHSLDPEFFDQHCTEVVLSRAVVEGAVRDLEQNAGRSFPDIDAFRYRRDEIPADSIRGAKRRLENYLLSRGIPVGASGSEVTLVDSGYKGSVQEMLAAIFPETTFQGRMIFHGPSPHDPHPGTKKGYAPRYIGEKSPASPALSAGDIQYFTMYTIESTLHGPLGSPKRLDESGPVQRAERFEPDQLSGLNPVRVGSRFLDPVTREAAQEIGLIGLKDYADRIAGMIRRGEPWQTELDAGVERYRSLIESWLSGSGADQKFAEFADAFVMRDDARIISELAQAVDDANVPPGQAEVLWNTFDRLSSLEEKGDFLNQFRRGVW